MKKILISCVAMLIMAATMTSRSEAPEPAASLPTPTTLSGYIVQAQSTDIAHQAVDSVAGEVTRTLGAVGAVRARLTPTQVKALRERAYLRVIPVGQVSRA